MEIVALASNFKTPFLKNAITTRDEQNFYTDTTSSDYGQLRNKDADVADLVFNGFDVSSIPADAKITNVFLKIKFSISTYKIIYRKFAVYIGNTFIKDLPVNLTDKTATILTYDNLGEFTLSDLQNFNLLYESQISSGYSTYERLYGIELHVEYEEGGTPGGGEDTEKINGFKIGSENISKIYAGGAEVLTAYIGEQKIYG